MVVSVMKLEQSVEMAALGMSLTWMAQKSWSSQLTLRTWRGWREKP